jgi:hypothetical protein
VRYSADEGLTWQDSMVADVAGPDADETSAFVRFGNKLGLIYLHQDSSFRWRVRTDGDGPTVWGASETLALLPKGLPASKSAYSIVVDNAQRIHMAYGDDGLRMLTYDGGTWTSTALGISAGHPSLSTDGTNIWLTYQETVSATESHIIARYYNGVSQTWSANQQQVSSTAVLNMFPTMIANAGSGPVVAWVMGDTAPRPVMTTILGIIP